MGTLVPSAHLGSAAPPPSRRPAAPIPARTAWVCLLPGDAGRYLVTDIEVRYDGPGSFGIWDSCPPSKVSGPKLRAAMDARVAGRGWRRSGDWQPAETNPPWRGWIAPIEPIPKEA